MTIAGHGVAVGRKACPRRLVVARAISGSGHRDQWRSGGITCHSYTDRFAGESLARTLRCAGVAGVELLCLHVFAVVPMMTCSESLHALVLGFVTSQRRQSRSEAADTCSVSGAALSASPGLEILTACAGSNRCLAGATCDHRVAITRRESQPSCSQISPCRSK